MVKNIIHNNGSISFATYLEQVDGKTVQFMTTIEAQPQNSIETLFRIGEAVTLLAETVQTWIETNKPDEGWKLVAHD
jgi:hypothetical protein